MPLIQSKSKKAFSKNVETEMNSGKPQDQSLAIAYSIKRKNKKKMAEGGSIKDEKRPSPEGVHNDSKEVGLNSAKKPLHESKWTDQPTLAQAQSKPKMQSIKQPRMVPSNAFSTRMYNKEGMLMESAGPDEPKKMAKGGHVGMEMGKGPEDDELEHPAGLESDNDQMRPDEDEIMSGKSQMLAHGGDVDKMEEDYTDKPDKGYGAILFKAEGGDIGNEIEEDFVNKPEKGIGTLLKAEGGDIDVDEMENEKHSSIAAAIMAKNDRMHAGSGSEDEDAAEMYADGGEVDIMSNGEEEPNSYYHQNEDAVLKENYDHLGEEHQPLDSNEHDVSIAKDAHDMVDKIMHKMKSQRQLKKL